jgi:hypothetical protein
MAPPDRRVEGRLGPEQASTGSVFALTPIALFVITFALCLLTLPICGVHCALPIVVCSLALELSPSLVLRVAFGTEREPQLAKVVARLPQRVR